MENKMPAYLLRYGEIYLKGKNRIYFEKKLLHNLKAFLKQQNVDGRFDRLRNRIYAETNKEIDWKPVFGLISYSLCLRVEADYETIKKEVEKIAEEFSGKTRFRITANVSDARFNLSRQEMNEKLGAFVVQKSHAKVDLEKHEEEIGIEILQGNTYIYRKTYPCHGGLPVGAEGNVLLLVEEENSLLAGVLAMKRGCALYPVSKEKKDITLLEKYAWGTKPKLLLLQDNNTDEYIKKYEIQALVVGDTLANIKEYQDIPLPVLRPLIGYDPKRLAEEKRKYAHLP